MTIVDFRIMLAMRDAPGYWYLATAYSSCPRGIDWAFEEACRIAAWMLRRGVNVYSPIAHTHPIAKHGGIDPLDHSIWLPFDEPLMRAANGLIVAMMDGWKESEGIRHEVGVFADADKMIYHLPWPQPERGMTG